MTTVGLPGPELSDASLKIDPPQFLPEFTETGLLSVLSYTSPSCFYPD